MLAAFLLGCPPDPEIPPDATTCEEASERMGALVCAESMPDRDTWTTLSLDVEIVDQLRAVKYLIPVNDTAPLPGMFVNSQRYALHYDFLREVFPEAYGSLAWDDYVAMIINPAKRVYWGGDLSEYIETDGAHRFGFIVWDDPADATTAPAYEDVLFVWRALQTRFSLGELMYVPASENQRDTADTWTDTPFPIRGADGVTYEAYNPTYGYGTIRFEPLADLAADSASGAFGYQDILVLDEAPMDLERVVSGVVTGTRQAALSHLNVRMSARGTPNCYTTEPWTKLAAWEGKLVRLECGEDAMLIEEATPEAAQAWWDTFRPDPVVISPPDTDWETPMPLLDVPTATYDERRTNYLRFGAKGANLATLYQRIEPGVQLDGFLIPFAYYQRFMEENYWIADVDGGEESLTFAATIDRWHADSEFLTNAATRSARLTALREAMLGAPVNEADAASVRALIAQEFGGTDVMVRFRSSSNAEDGVVFSGAGLYDSLSACAADDEDGDSDGPSVCDDDKSSEKPVADALRGVWASLWKGGAWEERDWYGLEQRDVAMAVLVNDQSEQEQANIVAFTGNPTGEDERWLIEAQVGDIDVVSAESGVTPERTLLTVEGGAVTGIERMDESSEVGAGEEVLSDARLYEVGALLLEVDAVMPHDEDAPEGTLVLWDTEQKYLEDGRGIIKQIRPFARAD
ncbi:hypothetical protein LBMAG42_33730 [Deltaproteobacteria bacterium]|nr:hypothetical protein LBMAG42_33730 [Deltaproteobacteria bacterium]